MTNSITNIEPSNVPDLTYGGKPVVISSVLAQLYGTETKNIQKNYKRNESRFEEGKHYFKVEGNELKELKKQPSLRGLLSKMVSHLLLWTERGAARHAKMLETNQAWDVFEALEDNYFGKFETKADIPALPNPLSPSHQRDLEKAIASRIYAQVPKDSRPAAFKKIYSHLKDRFGVAKYDQIDESRYTEALGAVHSFELDGEWLPQQEQVAATLSDDDLSDLYILLCHAHIIEKKWRESHIEEALSILHAPIGGNLHENIQMAASFARRIAKAKGQLMERSRERLGLNYGLIPLH